MSKDVAFQQEGGLTLRDNIQKLENVMFAMKDAQIQIETKHHHAHKMYAREILIPKGTTLTGKIHKYSHINVISQGDISVMTENGIERIQAPCIIVSKPGTKRVGFAHEDTIWTTFHATEETDLEKIEEDLIAPSFESFELFQASQLLLEEK